MKKLFFAVVFTLGSFMFVNAQVQPQDDPENVIKEEVVQEEAVATEVQEENTVIEEQQSEVVVDEVVEEVAE